LKRQLAEYEREESSSQASSESSYSDLAGKIVEKERELEQTRNTTRKSTAPLRKEIELLKKLLGVENKFKELEVKEVEYKKQIREKETLIQAKQTEINRLKESEKVDKRKIERLEKQVGDLTSEKGALEEKMLGERREALAE
jgi:chromosome segregation ATPase